MCNLHLDLYYLILGSTDMYLMQLRWDCSPWMLASKKTV